MSDSSESQFCDRCDRECYVRWLRQNKIPMTIDADGVSRQCHTSSQVIEPADFWKLVWVCIDGCECD